VGGEELKRQFAESPASVSGVGYSPAMPQPPSLTPEQRAENLAKAARVRRERAELKDKLKMGLVTLPDLLDQAGSDDVVGKMKLVAVLESLPGVGKVKARRTMEEIGISETRRMKGVGAQQRAKLLEAFPPRS
jgi:hypothetical protein